MWFILYHTWSKDYNVVDHLGLLSSLTSDWAASEPSLSVDDSDSSDSDSLTDTSSDSHTPPGAFASILASSLGSSPWGESQWGR